MSKNKLGLIFVFVSLLGITYGQNLESWSHTNVMDKAGKYNLTTFINITSNLVKFEVMASNAQWIGLGLSPNPNMTNSDIFIAHFNSSNDGVDYDDYHGKENGRPTLDSVNNWLVTSWLKIGTGINITFTRSFNVSMNDEDKDIKNENIYLIWAYGDVTYNGTIPLIQYHGASRGFKQINLLQNPNNESSPLKAISLVLLLSLLSHLFIPQ